MTNNKKTEHNERKKRNNASRFTWFGTNAIPASKAGFTPSNLHKSKNPKDYTLKNLLRTLNTLYITCTKLVQNPEELSDLQALSKAKNPSPKYIKQSLTLLLVLSFLVLELQLSNNLPKD